jgi:hypothetical protein
MIMDKELALAIDFKKAPKEVQDAATLHYTNIKKRSLPKTKRSAGCFWAQDRARPERHSTWLKEKRW